MKVKNLYVHCRTLILVRTFAPDTEMYIVAGCLTLIPYFTSLLTELPCQMEQIIFK